MCGIAGELRLDGSASNLATTKAMCDAQFHRGPDDDGYYVNGPVSLGIRRLAIIDLTKGLYPIKNEDNTIHLVFNGEIYGFDALRAELERQGHNFRSKTDAETVVHSYEQRGIGCLEKLNGMFAFALWDEEERQLWIARDHFGIKPLYYHLDGNFFAFASEIKPLISRPDIPVLPNERIIRDYVERAQIDHTADTFFDGIKQLRPGHQLLISPNGGIRLERYWTPKIAHELDGNDSEDEVENTRRLFLDAITQQLISDVPVGTCLSGGIDSSSIVCAIRNVKPEGAVSTGKWIRTFSAIFPGYPIDESEYAKIVCDAAGAEYNPVQPTADELWEDLPTLIRCQEEPFLSSSIYAQFRVMKRAKERGITVLLDGQGSDELLCGYPYLYLHYLRTLSQHAKFSKLLYEGIRSLDQLWPLIKANPRSYLARLLAYGMSVVRHPKTSRSKATVERSENELCAILEFIVSTSGLPALLRYEDKNSMWHSIEARVPFLHKPFFEFVASLPLDRKLRGGWTKYIFRRAVSGILPEEIRLRRRKIGFETPEKRWIEGDLRERLQAFFADSDLLASKFYCPATVRNLLRKPSLTVQETSLLWRVLNIEMWYREFFGNR